MFVQNTFLALACSSLASAICQSYLAPNGACPVPAVFDPCCKYVCYSPNMARYRVCAETNNAVVGEICEKCSGPLPGPTGFATSRKPQTPTPPSVALSPPHATLKLGASATVSIPLPTSSCYRPPKQGSACPATPDPCCAYSCKEKSQSFSVCSTRDQSANAPAGLLTCTKCS